MEDLHTIRLREIALNLPEKPGVYEYFNKEGKIIYIGKAKNLKKRVSSYFNKSHDSKKTGILVRNIRKIEHLVVDTEQDALLLENNLIKKYQPRYNVLLKDDKTFPWICIKNERFPRVIVTRNFIRDGSSYFGPFTSGKLIRVIMDLIRHLYKIRTCNLFLSKQNIENKKYKVCLEYHLGNCKAPCIGAHSEEDYQAQIVHIQNILKGNIRAVIAFVKDKMKEFSDQYRFEEAHEMKIQLEMLEKYQSKSTVVSTSLHNIDVFSFYEKDNFTYVNYLRVVNGAIIQSHTVEIKRKLEESPEDLLLLAIIELRSRMHSESKEIILPFSVDYQIDSLKITLPKRGEKKILLELSERNAKYFALEQKKQRTMASGKTSSHRILEKLKSDLNLDELPVRIECFDNSNIQGSNPVASCVVFSNARPNKKEYRHFNIKTVVGPDDFASMKEIVHRRYKRQIEEKQTLPQLIIIDGGKGQLRAAVEGLSELEFTKKPAIIGIAKRLEEIYFPGDSVPLYIDKNSESLKLIQHLRNEAHRFAISFHRDKRSQNFLNSELENIPGVGLKTIEKLIIAFGSLKKIQEQSSENLAQIIGKDKAVRIKSFFEKSN